MMFLFPLLLTSLVNEWKQLHENSLSMWARLAVLALKCPGDVALKIGILQRMYGVVFSWNIGFLYALAFYFSWSAQSSDFYCAVGKHNPIEVPAWKQLVWWSNHKWVFLGFIGINYETDAINICWSLNIFSLGKYQKYKYGHIYYSSCQ